MICKDLKDFFASKASKLDNSPQATQKRFVELSPPLLPLLKSVKKKIVKKLIHKFASDM